ncbi:hypothetical protein CC2G_015284 [Coprinopsis cinerea AmutBmut pab1-1]|nr:hypothetical protein CC2G_015284 [Coprinopsis cinerea AmutBmut pab1-1]
MGSPLGSSSNDGSIQSRIPWPPSRRSFANLSPSYPLVFRTRIREERIRIYSIQVLLPVSLFKRDLLVGQRTYMQSCTESHWPIESLVFRGYRVPSACWNSTLTKMHLAPSTYFLLNPHVNLSNVALESHPTRRFFSQAPDTVTT